MFHFREQLFTLGYDDKHRHYMLCVDDNVGELPRWKAYGSYENRGCGKTETLNSNLNTEDQGVPYAVDISFQSTLKDEEIILKN